MTDRIPLKASWSEVWQGALVGIMRQIQDIKENRKHLNNCPPEKGWSNHIEGAIAELLVAKMLGRFWNGNVGDLKSDDVGPYQVRQAAYDHYSLILHDTDKDNKPYILVTGLAPTYYVRGWLLGGDRKKVKKTDPVGGRPAYFVPQSLLHPMAELPILERP